MRVVAKLPDGEILLFLSDELRIQSKAKLQRQLDQSRVVTRSEDTPKIPGINDSSGICIDAAARRRDCIEIADRIVKVYVIEKIEKLGSKLDFFGFGNAETFADREVHVCLLWTTQNVATHVADVSTRRVRTSSAVRTGNQLPGCNDRPHKSEGIKKISVREIAGRSIAR